MPQSASAHRPKVKSERSHSITLAETAQKEGLMWHTTYHSPKKAGQSTVSFGYASTSGMSITASLSARKYFKKPNEAAHEAEIFSHLDDKLPKNMSSIQRGIIIPISIDTTDQYQLTTPKLSLMLSDLPDLLLTLTKEQPQLAQHAIIDIFKSMIRTLNSLSIAGIVHKDFKPGNIGLRISPQSRITMGWVAIDLGASQYIDSKDIYEAKGTTLYIAPEESDPSLRSQSSPLKIDIYSYGLAIQQSIEESLKKPHNTSSFLQDINDILNAMLQEKPNNRIGLGELTALVAELDKKHPSPANTSEALLAFYQSKSNEDEDLFDMQPPNTSTGSLAP